MDEIECTIVGAGVIGLAAARALARAGREVVVLEAEGLIGSHTSSRNSEVIHAGIYYPQGSAKARLCLKGREALYAYCAAHNIAHARLGKVIVATDPAQEAALATIAARARACGVEDLRPLARADLAALEPDLSGIAGLLSPSTGILDSHGYMLALQGEIESHGGMIAFHTRLTRARPVPGGFVIETESNGETTALRTRLLINAAGLEAGAVARSIQGLPPERAPRIHTCKGNYFALTGQRVPFSHLIYPVPERDGLGVHLTLGLDGRGRFGPDTEWVETIDYSASPERAGAFYAAIRRYWPDLRDGVLTPDYTGIRPKRHPEGGPATDFAIEGPRIHGIPGLVNLFGIESPGLTASLAIAEEVAARL